MYNINDFINEPLYHSLKKTSGYVTIPLVIINRKSYISQGVIPGNMRTFHNSNGSPYLVAFTEVPMEKAEAQLRVFSSEVKAYFDQYGDVTYHKKFSRCIVNGKVCPLSNSCSQCTLTDEDGVPLREQQFNRMLSYDAMVIEIGAPSLEAETNVLRDELLQAAYRVNPVYPGIIRLSEEGYNASEISEKLGMKPTHGWKTVKATPEFAWDYLRKN